MKKIKVKIDATKCMNCGSCSALAPEAIELNAEGIAEVKPEYREVIIDNADLVERLLLARDSCPNGAVVIKEIND